MNRLRNSLAAACAAIATYLMTASTASAQNVAPASAALRESTTAQDNLTYHGSNARLGWYNHETQLTTAGVASSAFHLIGTMKTAGKSYSQPLYVSNQTIGYGSIHNLLIVTDSTDVVYAYDADSLKLVWERSFTGAGVRQQLASDTGCGDVWPNVGINGTPVIDRGRGAIYVVVPTFENAQFFLRLHAISLTGGADLVKPKVIATGTANSPSISPLFNFDRAGLVEAGNNVYVGLSTHCDFNSGASHGWLIGFNADTLAVSGRLFDTTPVTTSADGGTQLGSIWQGGFGIAADANNNLFFATGNGPADGVRNFGQSVLSVPPDLKPAKLNFFTPSTWQQEAASDADIGSAGVMLLPDQTAGRHKHLAIAGGKTGEKFLMNRDSLGGFNAQNNVLFDAIAGTGQWGGPAYFVDTAGAQHILYGATDLLNLTLGVAPYSLTVTDSTTVGPPENRVFGVTPVVSSNGTVAGSAIVWALSTPRGSNVGAGQVDLFGFDAVHLKRTLFQAVAGQWIGNGNAGGAMITPLVANGRVYVATDGMVTAFGIH